MDSSSDASESDSFVWLSHEVLLEFRPIGDRVVETMAGFAGALDSSSESLESESELSSTCSFDDSTVRGDACLGGAAFDASSESESGSGWSSRAGCDAGGAATPGLVDADSSSESLSESESRVNRRAG